MKIFSVTVLIFLTHSLSFTMGTRASRILRGMGPAERNTLKTGKIQLFSSNISVTRWSGGEEVEEVEGESGFSLRPAPTPFPLEPT